MTVFSYIVTHDTGFSPNPFHGYCTLACCKPQIRRTAQVGDWVVGLSMNCARIVYAMRITEEPLTFAAYWGDERFKKKRPVLDTGRVRDKCGDNIYEPDRSAALGFRQIPSQHSTPRFKASEDQDKKAHDLNGDRVLVSTDFVYYGGGGPDLPQKLAFLKVVRGHRCDLPQQQVRVFLLWVSKRPRGIQGRPTKWSKDDDTWKGCS
jgi:hypothetical protein